jgi:predicted DNA-binding transcriptional regulator YafY
MNRIERLTAILLLLQERPRTSGEIARRFEISKRTVLRDVQALCEMGVPVIAQPGAGGGYSLDGEYLSGPLPLTAPEVFLLLLALSHLTRLSDAPFAPQRASLLAKLRALLPEQHLAAVERMLAAVEVDVPERPARAPFLEPLLAAAEQGRWVEVTYQSAERRSTQRLWPRQISLQNGYWYCRAYAHEHEEERTYRVDRIRALATLDEQLQPAPPPPAPPYDHDSHPEIVVALTARGAAQVESEPHIGQLVRHHPDGTGSLLFRCPPGELSWFARYFAGLGPDAQVQAPAELRADLARLGRQLVEQYRDR